MNNYPEIYLSDELVNFKKNTLQILANYKYPEISEKPPILPNPPEKSASLSFSFFLSPLLFTFFAFLFSKFNIQITVIVYFLILAIIFAFYLRLNHKSEMYAAEYVKLKEIYDKEITNYKYKIAKRNIQYNEYILGGEYAKTYPNEINEYITKVILPKTVKAKQKYLNPKKGKTEENFAKILINYFGNSIKTNHIIQLFEYNEDEYFGAKNKNAYCPDIIFEHKLTDLCIDIEIDEPYNDDGGLHTISDLKDYERNKYFKNKGWVIIRFSEEQIKNAPLSCCKEIAKIIKIITNDKSFYKIFENTPEIYKHRKWDFEDIPILKMKNYRNLKNGKIEELL